MAHRGWIVDRKVDDKVFRRYYRRQDNEWVLKYDNVFNYKTWAEWYKQFTWS